MGMKPIDEELAQRIKDKSGNVTGYQSAILDNSELKESEKSYGQK